jgi:hypothetical protein
MLQLFMRESLVVPRKAGRHLREVDIHAAYKDGTDLAPVLIHLWAIRGAKLSIAEGGQVNLGHVPKRLALLRCIDTGQPDPILRQVHVQQRDGVSIVDPNYFSGNVCIGTGVAK